MISNRGMLWLAVVAVWLVGEGNATNTDSTLDCHKRYYTYKVTQTDPFGLACYDTIKVMSCWGRCDSNEISDWRFPYKKSYHPVCQHGARETRRVILRSCDPGYAPGTEVYLYLHPITCECHVCKSSEASCEGLRAPLDGLASRTTAWESLIFHGNEPSA